MCTPSGEEMTLLGKVERFFFSFFAKSNQIKESKTRKEMRKAKEAGGLVFAFLKMTPFVFPRYFLLEVVKKG